MLRARTTACCVFKGNQMYTGWEKVNGTCQIKPARNYVYKEHSYKPLGQQERLPELTPVAEKEDPNM